jgi:hypothetical protein
MNLDELRRPGSRLPTGKDDVPGCLEWTTGDDWIRQR